MYLVTNDEDGLDDDVDDDGGLLHRAALPAAAIAIACNRVVGAAAGDVGALKVVDSQTIMLHYLRTTMDYLASVASSPALSGLQ